MIVSHESRNFAVLTDGKKTTVLRYDTEYLRKYSSAMLLYNWTRERVLHELRSNLAIEIELKYKNESESEIEKTLDSIMPYASANIHDPRKE